MITIIDFYATWCIPCKKLDPYLEKFKEDYPNLTFIKVDIDKEKELTDKFDINAVPTIIIHNDNNEILAKIEGFNPNKLEEEIIKYK